MNSQNKSFSKPIRGLLIIIAIWLIQISVPCTDVYSFAISSDEVRLKKPFAVYKYIVTLMASAQTEIQTYRQATSDHPGVYGYLW